MPATTNTSVAVVICTRGRPVRLMACLDSLLAMDIPRGVNPHLVVVENDVSAQCQSIVLNLASRATAAWQIHYTHEPQLGIPIARNRGLDMALELDADWVGFIDDDEVARPDWLQAMMNALHHFDADVMQGPVSYIYPESSPVWLERKTVRDRSSGTQLPTAYTNNLLMKAWVARPDGLGIRFNEAMRFTGGSDTEYYTRAADKGAVIRWVREAVVEEPVTPERLTMSWQAKRALRVAANATTLDKRRFGLLHAIRRYMPKHITRLTGGTAITLLSLPPVGLGMPLGKRLFFKGIKDVSSACGGLMAFFNFAPQPYLTIDGDQQPVNASPALSLQSKTVGAVEKLSEPAHTDRSAQLRQQTRVAAR